ncbi:MAG: putative lipid II flippase FtsW [Acidimicrobiia bacterium]
MTVATVAVPSRVALREAQRREQSITRAVVLLMVPVVLLLVVGLGAMLSASSVVGLRETGDSLYHFKRHVVWLVVGVVAMVVAALMPMSWWRRLAFPVFFCSVALLVAVLAVGVRSGGATRWLAVGPVSVQPSEAAKLSTILLLATVMSRRERWIAGFWSFLVPVVLSSGVVIGLIMLQPDFGTTVVVAAASFAIMLASAAPFGYVVGSAIGAAGLGVVGAISAPYRWQRVTAFLDLQSDPFHSSYQAIQGLVALGTGGLFGVGLGASRARWSYLPNAHTDFVFAILGEETGLAGSLLVVALFTTLTVAGTMIARNCSDRFGRLAAIGITAWLSVQALVNIGGVVGLLPITGVPLPFMSFGGTALVVSLIGVGILVSIARHTEPIGVGPRR